MRRCHETTEDGGVWDPKIVELLERTGTTEVVDLCSGGGEPVIAMAKVLEKSCGRRLRLTLTDLIPNREAARMVARDNPDCLLRVPSPAPEMAVRLPKDSFENRRAIFIGETTRCTYKAVRPHAEAALWFPEACRYIGPTRTQRFFTWDIPSLAPPPDRRITGRFRNRPSKPRRCSCLAAR